MTKTFVEIHTEAKQAAAEAASKFFLETLGGRDRGACGFAWVNVRVNLRTKQAKEMKEYGFDKLYGRTGVLQYWNPSKYPVQNVDCLEAGARAYAKVLCDNGYDAWADSRLD